LTAVFVVVVVVTAAVVIAVLVAVIFMTASNYLPNSHTLFNFCSILSDAYRMLQLHSFATIM